MYAFSEQLPLGMSLRDDATFDNFYGQANREIVLELKKTASGAGERVVYLSGVRGQGCSHLLQACCHYAHHHDLRSVYLPLEHLLSLSPEVLNNLETLDLICVDDLHLASGNRRWEEASFHLYNRIFDAKKAIVFGANVPPKGLNLSLPDLVSRLSFGIVFQLAPLTDEEKLDALITRAYRRGIKITEEVGKYLLSHSPRHMARLFGALEVLDKASLAAQRRVTIPFVKKVLNIK